MGKRGTKPMSHEVKVIRGTMKPHRDNRQIIQRSINAVPEPPEGLDEHGMLKWYDFLSYAVEIKGYIAPAELGLIEQMCQSWQQYKKMLLIVESEGEVIENNQGNRVINPSYKVLESAYDRYYKIMREFGMTPTTRSSVKLVSETKKKDFEDL